MINDRLKNAIELAFQAVHPTPEERARIFDALKNGDSPPKEKFIQTKEAATILEACGKTVFRYEARGLLHGIRRSKRCIRWRKSEVDKLAMNGATL